MNEMTDPQTTAQPNLSPDEFAVLSAFFSEGGYLNINTDVANAGLVALDHFLANGFAEGRALSHAVMRGTLDFIVSKSACALGGAPQTLSDLARVLRDWPIDQVYGPAPLVCPIWLKSQPECAACQSLADIMQTTIPVGQFTIHPALAPFYVSTSMSVLEIIELIYAEQQIHELSLIDLSDYTANHRDLNTLKDKNDEAFNHLWSYGPLENRLKYLGHKRLHRLNPQQYFLAQLKTVLHVHLGRGSLPSSRDVTALTPFNIRTLKSNGSVNQGIQFIIGDEINDLDPAEVMRNIISLKEILDDVSTFIIEDETPESPATHAVGSQCLTDQDLLSGKHKVTTKRVVYGVNIGSYDDFPVPPQLDDCSYFLITDAAIVPANTPWIIVRPTIRENDVKRQCLWYKTHPHWLFPSAEFVTWIDSNVRCQTHSDRVLLAHESMSEIATFAHPDRDCVYTEASKLIELQLDNADVIHHFCATMKGAGFPDHAGLFETNVLFSRIQDLGVRAFFDTWWRNIYLGSRRDQMSFTYSAWSEGVEVSRLDAGFSAKDSRFFTKKNHKSKRGRFV